MWETYLQEGLFICNRPIVAMEMDDLHVKYRDRKTGLHFDRRKNWKKSPAFFLRIKKSNVPYIFLHIVMSLVDPNAFREKFRQTMTELTSSAGFLSNLEMEAYKCITTLPPTLLLDVGSLALVFQYLGCENADVVLGNVDDEEFDMIKTAINAYHATDVPKKTVQKINQYPLRNYTYAYIYVSDKSASSKTEKTEKVYKLNLSHHSHRYDVRAKLYGLLTRSPVAMKFYRDKKHTIDADTMLDNCPLSVLQGRSSASRKEQNTLYDISHSSTSVLNRTCTPEEDKEVAAQDVKHRLSYGGYPSPTSSWEEETTDFDDLELDAPMSPFWKTSDTPPMPLSPLEDSPQHDLDVKHGEDGRLGTLGKRKMFLKDDIRERLGEAAIDMDDCEITRERPVCKRNKGGDVIIID